MNQPQGITIEYKHNFMGTFVSTLVAVLIAVPVAMFVSYTIMKTNSANAATFQQSAVASPVNTVGYPVPSSTAANVCTQPDSNSTTGNGSANGLQMSYLPGGGIPQYVINNTSTITQNQSESNTNITNNTWIRDSYNDNSVIDSYNTDVEIDVEIEDSFQIGSNNEDSFQDNDTTINDSFQDNSTNIDIEDSFTIEDSFQDNSVTQTAIGLLAGNIND